MKFTRTSALKNAPSVSVADAATDGGSRRSTWGTWPDLLLRLGICVSVAISGYIHFDLYKGGYRYIHMIGPSFLLQAAASFAITILLLLGGPFVLRLAAAALAAGALGAFVLSRTVGIFGFTEIGWQPAPKAAVSVVVEVATIVLCVASLLIRMRNQAEELTSCSATSASTN